MKKFKIFITYLILVIFFTGCIFGYLFQPIQTDYLDQLSFDDVKIKYVSFYAWPEDIKIKFDITNDGDKKIIISDEIEIIGTYFESFKIHHLVLDDLLTDKVDGIIVKDRPFEVSLKKFSVQSSCFSEKKLKTKEVFDQFIKREKFKVKLPTFVIDGKEYEFETVDFVYKK